MDLSSHRHRAALARNSSIRGGVVRLVIEPISAEAFAPHGTLVRAPADIGRNAYPDALLNKRPDARPTLSASRGGAEVAALDRDRDGAPPLLLADVLSARRGTLCDRGRSGCSRNA